ncbi:ComF family protein [Pedobacter arcticus]|uniref:ComF family protein n=1 Tax=Pedobacter arcticus TaxID=752140 RepID=UPI0002E42221|nr:phosphoribosyltransferase family protein [Pedobacter arcticus]
MSLIGKYLNDFGSLFFPEVCQACGTTLSQQENHFCNTCLHHFPYTNFHLDADNRLAKQFWGRINISSAAAFLYFNKGGTVQNAMHQLKYNKQPQVGVALGNLYAQELKQLAQYQEAEAIIPVPLHLHKLQTRGYNQSEAFANGLSEILNIPVYTDILSRNTERESQAKQSRSNRFENMQKVFSASSNGVNLDTVLLVDDTITTGATLEACVIALQDIGIKNIHIVGIAFTE